MKLLTSLGLLDSKTNDVDVLIAEYAIKQKQKVFDQLYAQLADDLYHYLVSLSDQDLAQDIAQKTWLKVYEKPQRYQGKAGFKFWLFRVGRNALIDEFRKQNRVCHLLEEHLTEDGTRQEDILEQDIQLCFDRALMALPFLQREAFCLQQEGFSLEQIAQISGDPKETIKTRLRYAKGFLKRRLETLHE
ncbi:RNA polymerase sigma factor [Glaciecola siphonariae]|uniref:RNA polymerase sigma factor n=1 Tax=Glaciecola siphonariae TaxID=521012 RepID=A0ABV9LSA5_9ALTE